MNSTFGHYSYCGGGHVASRAAYAAAMLPRPLEGGDDDEGHDDGHDPCHDHDRGHFDAADDDDDADGGDDGDGGGDGDDAIATAAYRAPVCVSMRIISISVTIMRSQFINF